MPSQSQDFFRMEMEATTDFDGYDYGNYTGEYLVVQPCSGDRDNTLGAWLSVIYYFMFVFSLLGNGLVLVIIHRFEKLTTVTNILLLNLVLSSLIFVSSLPFQGVYMQLSDWVFGKAMCKLVGGVYYLGFYSSVLFLTLLTFDRHLAVVYSLEAPRLRSRGYAVASCGVVWLVSGLACVRPMILHSTFTYMDMTLCDDYPSDLEGVDVVLLKESGFYLQLFLFLAFPLAVIVFCYVRIALTVLSSKIRSKFKTVRLILVIVVLFFACWTPFNVVLLLHDKAVASAGCEERQRLAYALQVTRNLAHIYFCVSPAFYTFVGRKFQSYFRQMLVQRYPKLRGHISVSQHSGKNLSTKSAPE